MSIKQCPVCGGTQIGVMMAQQAVEAEIHVREAFIFQRLSEPASPAELKDLTDFAHNTAAAIMACQSCGFLLRDEHEEDYANDQYNPGVMERLYPRYLNAFRRKENVYRHLLPEGARVLEVGSHFGAFLEVATEWGWDVTGVDIGKDTSQFAMNRSFRVCCETLAGCGFEDEIFDGVFIWNCFEQIPDETSLLREIYRILKPRGLLVLRTPNALFYKKCEQSLKNGASEIALKAMGFNNLLGFPYLYGHSAATLNQMVERYGFTFEQMLNSELIIFPLPHKSESVRREQQYISKEIKQLGPWIEMSYRRV